MLKKILISGFVALFMGLLFSGCATIKKNEYSPEGNNYEKKIAVLYHSTQFRNEIAGQLIERLKGENIFVTTDDATKINNYDPKLYDLVVVFSGIHAFIPDAYPNAYLAKYRNEKNILHVRYTFLSKKGITIKNDNPNKIDTITAASLTENQNGLIDEIFNEINNKLGL